MFGVGIPWGLILRLVGLASAVAACWWAFDTWTDGIDRRGYLRGKAEIQQLRDQDTAAAALKAQQATESARAREHEQWRNDERIRDEQARLSASTASALAAARTERDRLRIAIAAAVGRAPGGAASTPDAPASGPDAAAARAGELLDRCAERREGVAAEAAGLAQQLIGLQAWAVGALKTCNPIDTPKDHP